VNLVCIAAGAGTPGPCARTSVLCAMPSRVIRRTAAFGEQSDLLLLAVRDYQANFASRPIPVLGRFRKETSEGNGANPYLVTVSCSLRFKL